MKLSRKKIQAMIETDGLQRSVRVNNGGGGGGGAGVSEAWVDKNYVSIEFFNRLFTAYKAGATESDPDIAIEPNDTESIIKNIKAKSGLWTDQFMSALGQNSGSGGGGGGATRLDALSDVAISNPTNGQVLKYNSTTGKWYNGTDSGVSSVAWGDITGKPSTIAGYNIGDAYISGGTVYLGGSSLSPLLLSGGTMTGTIRFSTSLTAYIRDSAGNWILGKDGSDISIGSANIANTIALNNNSGYLYLSSDGKVGIGTTTPAYTLHVNGNFGAYGTVTIGDGANSARYLYLIRNSGRDGGILFNHVVSGSSENNWQIVDESTNRNLKFYSYRTAGDKITINGANDDTPLTVSAFQSNAGCHIKFMRSSTTLGWFGYSSDGTALCYTGSTPRTIIHSGNISTQSVSYATSSGDADTLDGQHGSYYAAASSLNNYLPLTGGTLSGNLKIGNETQQNTYLTLNRKNDGGIIFQKLGTSKWQLVDNNNDGIDYYSYTANKVVTTVTGIGYVGIGTTSPSTQLEVYSSDAGIIKVKRNASIGGALIDYVSNNASTISWRVGSSASHGFIFERGGETKIGISSDGKLGVGTESPSYKLDVRGTISNGTGEIKTNLISIYTSAGDIGWMGAPNTAAATKDLCIYSNGGNIRLIGGSTTNVGIGTSSPSYKLHVAGDIYATGGVSCLSDERFKTIKGDTTLTVDQIAKMPSIKYTWNDGREDKDVHVGSIAQRWMEVLPEVVLKANDEVGTLSINYGVAAIIASITTARKVVDHERRIKELEKECERLRFENEQLKLKIA